MRTIVLCLLVTVSFPGLAQKTELRLASDTWPPFTDVASERAFAVDLVKWALSRVGVSTSTEILHFDDVIAGIREEKFDGTVALWRSPEREEFLIYSAPYLNNQLILVGRKGSDVDARTWSDLAGKRVAIVDKYAYGSSVQAAKEVVFVAGGSDQENLTRLLNKEADYMLVDALLMQYLLTYQEEEVAQYLEIGSNTLVRRSLHFAIRKDLPGAQNIVDRFNDEILKMVADGSYNRILRLNWIRTDIDGDGRVELVLAGNKAGSKAPTSSYDVFFKSSTAVNSSSKDRYYVDGRFYEGWEQVPQQYKVPVVGQEVEDFNFLKFKF